MDPTSKTITATEATNYTSVSIQQCNRKQKRYRCVCQICVQLIHFSTRLLAFVAAEYNSNEESYGILDSTDVSGASLITLNMYSMHDNKHLHLEHIVRRCIHIAPRCLFLDTVTAEFKSCNTQKLVGVMATILQPLNFFFGSIQRDLEKLLITKLPASSDEFAYSLQSKSPSHTASLA